MSKTMFILGILASILSLNLTISIQAKLKQAKSGTATVSGLVTLKGDPARGVIILLREPGVGSSNSLRVRTDDNGRFRFSGVTAGSYTISALAPGYISPGDENFGTRGLTLSVANGEKIENITIEIKRGAVIAGRIIDLLGRPVIEETVNLSRLDKNGNPQIYRDNGPLGEIYRTDDRGDYHIFGLPEGRYLVSVGNEQKHGAVQLASKNIFYPRAYYPNANSAAEAKVVEVTEGAEATDIDITVPAPTRNFGVYGRVVNGDTGQPVSDVGLSIAGITRDGKLTEGFHEISENSKSNGEFHLMVGAPGRYIVLARHDIRGGNNLIGEAVTFEVGDGDTTGVDVIVRQGASISGVVVIEGTIDPKILSKLSEVALNSMYMKSSATGSPIFPGIQTASVKADGSFRMGRLQTGRVYLATSQSNDTRGLTVSRIEYNGESRNEIEIVTGEQITGVRVILEYSTLTLRGELKVIGGESLPQLRFAAVASKVDQPYPSSPAGRVDDQGRFVFEYLAPGEYEVSVFPINFPNSEQLDSQTMQRISSVKVRAVVDGTNRQPVRLVIDLGRKE